jgi:hypothetical protein
VSTFLASSTAFAPAFIMSPRSWVRVSIFESTADADGESLQHEIAQVEPRGLHVSAQADLLPLEISTDVTQFVLLRAREIELVGKPSAVIHQEDPFRSEEHASAHAHTHSPAHPGAPVHARPMAIHHSGWPSPFVVPFVVTLGNRDAGGQRHHRDEPENRKVVSVVLPGAGLAASRRWDRHSPSST